MNRRANLRIAALAHDLASKINIDASFLAAEVQPGLTVMIAIAHEGLKLKLAVQASGRGSTFSNRRHGGMEMLPACPVARGPRPSCQQSQGQEGQFNTF